MIMNTNQTLFPLYSYKGWLGGYQMSFDTSKSKLTKNNFAVGYEASDFTIHTNVWVLKKSQDHRFV